MRALWSRISAFARQVLGSPQDDPRSAALRRFGISITALTVLGHTVLGFEQAYATPVVAVLAGLATECVLEAVEAFGARVRARPRFLTSPGTAVDFLLPSYITGLACAMLLYANDRLMPTVLATVVGVASKYVIRVRIRGRLRHVLNPSNTGIALVLVLFPWVGIAPPYQFTEWTGGFLDAAIPLAVLATGTMLNGKLTDRVPLILGWVGGFVGQAVIRWAVTDIHLVSALLPVTGVAFVLFTNYMITDPATTPGQHRAQAVFGAITATVYGVLVFFHIVFGLFFALVISCGLRGVVIVVSEHRRRRNTGAPSSSAEPGHDLPAQASDSTSRTPLLPEAPR